MRILITGGAGFIGSHLCKRLSEKNEVVCMDNLLTGKKSNIDGLNVEFLEQDITEPFDVNADLVFNMASPASPVFYQKYPLETLETNSAGIKNVLENARKYNAKVVQASTSEVYGDPKLHPQPETYWGNVNPIGPRSCYDEGKRFAESLCMNYHTKYEVDVVLARIFNTYGPNMLKKDGRVVPNFICQALKNEKISVYGNGEQTRSFCYADDLVEGLVLLSEKGRGGEVYNLGNPREYTILQLAEQVKEACNSSSEIDYRGLPEDDPIKRKPDIAKVISETGWNPKVELKEGLSRTVEWFRGVC
ncbi:NAD-dependent epimerase/dehydratase family protein [Candidatus Micrarchaeota archaeon]|nr:NAD-dependent epimerase/dehydratase family protein [Candidatus Micrarchaeota archaeon]